MKKVRIIALIMVAMMLFSALAGCSKSGGSDESIKIGLIGPLTGEVAAYGLAVENAVNLYINQLNEDGGIGGRKIEIISYDDKHDATEATNAYNKLVTSDEVVAIIGAVTSKPCLAVAQLSVADNIPMMTPTATHEDVTSFGNNMFRSCFLDPYQGSMMANFAYNELGASTAAVIYNNSDAYSTGLYEAFVAKAGELGLEIVATESYGASDADYKAQLTTINAANPDVVFAPDYYNTLYTIVSQGRETGITVPFLGVDGADGVLGIEGIDTSIVEGVYFVNHYSTQDESPLVQTFLTSYTEKYNEDPSALAALGYDGAMILCAAIAEVAKDMDIDNSEECFQAIIDALEETDMDCVTGHVTYDELNNPNKTCAVIKIVSGEYTLYGKF